MALLKWIYPTVTAYLGFENQADKYEYKKRGYPLRETLYSRVLTIGTSHDFILKGSWPPVAHQYVLGIYLDRRTGIF